MALFFANSFCTACLFPFHPSYRARDWLPSSFAARTRIWPSSHEGSSCVDISRHRPTPRVASPYSRTDEQFMHGGHMHTVSLTNGMPVCVKPQKLSYPQMCTYMNQCPKFKEMVQTSYLVQYFIFLISPTPSADYLKHALGLEEFLRTMC